MRRHRLPAILLVLSAAARVGIAQTASPPMPRDYPGVQTQVPGIFITPVPNAPFIATVDIVSHQKLPDGTVQIRTTMNHIARQSSGRIYNERRRLVPTGFQGDPALLSAHTYDPGTRLSVFLDPVTRLARETVLKQPPKPAPNAVPGPLAAANPLYTEQDLGTQSMSGLLLHGTRKSRTIPARASDTGGPVVILDEYWYSPELSIYMIVKHNDPRTGEQIVAVSAVQRGEPDPALFEIPAKYKIVDETPVD